MKTDTYILHRRAGVWHINARCPKNLGGGFIRSSCKTKNLAEAQHIRDKVLRPLFLLAGKQEVLENVRRKMEANIKKACKMKNPRR